jgi:S-ribosylhomocysteine lyase LuxS involved in autoinducer biosynthesis
VWSKIVYQVYNVRIELVHSLTIFTICKISEDIQKNFPIVEKINIKYLGTLEHSLAKMIIENTRNGTEVVIEVTPKFFSAWDFGKAM